PPQRFAAALSLGHGRRSSDLLRLFSDGVRPGSIQRLDAIAAGVPRFYRAGRHLPRSVAATHHGGAPVIMTLIVAKAIWIVGVVGWCIIRRPRQSKLPYIAKPP